MDVSAKKPTPTSNKHTKHKPHHDSSYKHIFSHPRMVIELFNCVLTEQTWAKQLDFAQLEKVNAHYSNEEQTRSSDIVWKVSLAAQPLYIYRCSMN